MKIAFFNTKPYDKQYFNLANQTQSHELHFFEPRLNEQTSALAHGFTAICAFVNDDLSAKVLKKLALGGTKLIALRCAGFNHVDLAQAKTLDLTIVRVPAYSPQAVAEHALALILALNRKLHKAYNRTREGNFSLEGLMGFDVYNKTVGVIGTGEIGAVFARMMKGIGCKVLAYDPYPNAECEKIGIEYVSLAELYQGARIISLHCPLTPQTHYMIDQEAIAQMSNNVVLINTGRGALINTKDIIAALKTQRIGALGLDVYEEEGGLFFENRSDTIITDDVFARLLTFPNVMITSHQGFFTHEAVSAIAKTTLENITEYEKGNPVPNQVS